MVFSAIYNQWGYVVTEFEQGVKAQKEFLTEKKARGSDPDEYDAGWLHFWESGLEQAKLCQRTTRYAFLRKTLPDANYLLIGFLCQLRLETQEAYPDNRYREGMMDALDSSIEWVVNDTLG